MAEAPLEHLVSLRETARLLGLGAKSLANRVCIGAYPELQAVKVFGRWKVRRSVIQQIQTEGTGATQAASTLRQRLDFPHFQRRRGARGG